MKPPRRRQPDAEATVHRDDPWWADRLDACYRHYWSWRGRRWLFDAVTPVSPAVARMDAARAMCLRRHGVDPLKMGPPAGVDVEGRQIDEVDR